MKEFTLTRPEIKICVGAISPNLKKMTSITDAMKLSGFLKLLESEQKETDKLYELVTEMVKETKGYLKDDGRNFTDLGAKYFSEENEKIIKSEVEFKYDTLSKDFIEKCPVEMIDAIRILEDKLFE